MKEYIVSFLDKEGHFVRINNMYRHTFYFWENIEEFMKEVVTYHKEVTQMRIYQPEDPVATIEYWDIDRKMILSDRILLYSAVKYEVENFFAEHGMTLPEMWAVVNHRFIGKESIDYVSINCSDFWKRTCLEDYAAAGY